MTQPTIRPIEKHDIPAVLEMVQALAAHHGDTPTLTAAALARDTLGKTPWITVLVAEAGRKLIGYTALCPLSQLQFGVRGMDMHHCFVAPGERGRGVGRALINASLQTSATLGCRYMTVGTHPDNTLAAAIYLSAGFEPLPPPGPRFRIKLPV